MAKKSNNVTSQISTLCLSLLLLLSGCDAPPPDRGLSAEQGEEAASPEFFSDAIPYCWVKPERPTTASVHVLVDASGSMNGFARLVHPMLDWIRSGVSQMRSTDISFADDEFQTSHFAQPKGVFNTTRWNQAPARYNASGDTNLHEAIGVAAEAGLAFILTDGVAAAKIGDAGKCAGGVDAGCVSSALEQYVHASTSTASDPGIWIVPVLSTFDGKFYSERRTSTFDPKRTLEQVESELDARVEISDPGTDSQGRLTFDYHGPRSMLLLVLAQDATLGRSAVRALMNRAGAAGVNTAEKLSAVPSGTDIAALQPLEVYPGYLPSLSWSELDQVDDPQLQRGPMDVHFEKDRTPPLIRVQCVSEKQARRAFVLRGDSGVSGSCVDMMVLPAFTFAMRARSQENQSTLRTLVSVRAPEGLRSDPTSRLDLTCGSERTVDCSDPITAQFTALSDYRAAAACVARDGCRAHYDEFVHSLSSVEPELEPHRIFDFSNLLRLFYEKVSRDERRVAFSELSFCKQ